MQVIGKKRLMDRAREQSRRYEDCVKQVERWCQIVSAATGSNFPDVRQTVNSADLVQGKVVFNIHGNDYRLITTIAYDEGRVYVKDLLTHKEYDTGAWKA